ncbi:SCAN domain-containing protein 3 [Trichonephila clavipes]|uniref:SCAN domain-containing protein 3 n=1 Tax=Trichonephila clavipes TaxID=2585209 RepID=A0A8X6V7B8_TRICX|nr:SCAN domain-containing protein 3 [Trichonephila clavipes]
MKGNDVNQQVVTLVKKHLESLTEYFARYYPKNADPRHGNMWIIGLFAGKIQDKNLSMHLKESLIDLRRNYKFHSSLSRSQFWLFIKSEYPFLSEQTMKILIQFSTTYLCEMAFSSVTAIKPGTDLSLK